MDQDEQRETEDKELRRGDHLREQADDDRYFEEAKRLMYRGHALDKDPLEAVLYNVKAAIHARIAKANAVDARRDADIDLIDRKLRDAADSDLWEAWTRLEKTL